MQAFAAMCNQSAVIKSLFWFAPSCLQSKLSFNCFCFNLEKNSVSHNFSLSLLQRKGNEENNEKFLKDSASLFVKRSAPC